MERGPSKKLRMNLGEAAMFESRRPDGVHLHLQVTSKVVFVSFVFKCCGNFPDFTLLRFPQARADRLKERVWTAHMCCD